MCFRTCRCVNWNHICAVDASTLKMIDEGKKRDSNNKEDENEKPVDLDYEGNDIGEYELCDVHTGE